MGIKEVREAIREYGKYSGSAGRYVVVLPEGEGVRCGAVAAADSEQKLKDMKGVALRYMPNLLHEDVQEKLDELIEKSVKDAGDTELADDTITLETEKGSWAEVFANLPGSLNARGGYKVKSQDDFTLVVEGKIMKKINDCDIKMITCTASVSLDGVAVEAFFGEKKKKFYLLDKVYYCSKIRIDLASSSAASAGASGGGSGAGGGGDAGATRAQHTKWEQKRVGGERFPYAYEYIRIKFTKREDLSLKEEAMMVQMFKELSMTSTVPQAADSAKEGTAGGAPSSRALKAAAARFAAAAGVSLAGKTATETGLGGAASATGTLGSGDRRKAAAGNKRQAALVDDELPRPEKSARKSSGRAGASVGKGKAVGYTKKAEPLEYLCYTVEEDSSESDPE